MFRNPLLSSAYGALAGAVVALGLLAFFGAMTGLRSVVAVTTVPGTVAVEGVFVATSTGLWLLVLFLGGIAGAVLCAVVYAVGRMLEPETARFPLGWLVPGAVVLAAVVGYAVVSLGVTMVGRETAEAGTIAISVTAAVAIAMVAGAASGAALTPVVDALARPASVGPRNEATPVSSRAFWTELAGAVGMPTLAIITVGLLAVGLSRVLLSAPSAIVSVVVFSVAAAIILGGTTLLATRPWERR